MVNQPEEPLSMSEGIAASGKSQCLCVLCTLWAALHHNDNGLAIFTFVNTLAVPEVQTKQDEKGVWPSEGHREVLASQGSNRSMSNKPAGVLRMEHHKHQDTAGAFSFSGGGTVAPASSHYPRPFSTRALCFLLLSCLSIPHPCAPATDLHAHTELRR